MRERKGPTEAEGPTIVGTVFLPRGGRRLAAATAAKKKENMSKRKVKEINKKNEPLRGEGLR